MITVKRNQVILTALVMMIAVAGYLNFTGETAGEAGTAQADESDGYGALELVEGDWSTLPDEGEEAAMAETGDETAVAVLDPITAQVSNDVDDTGAAIFVSATTGGDSSAYFAQARLERDQARSRQKDILTEMINSETLDKEQKADCANSMLELQKRIEKETAAEALLESKGFAEAYVRIDDTTVDVVVDKESLTEQDLAQIMDVVTRKTGCAESAVRVSTLKK